MKNLYLFLAAATMLLSGCAKEKLQQNTSGDTVTVNLCAKMVNQSTTRAAIDDDGNGVNADQCKLQIWWGDVLYFEKTATVTDFTASFNDIVLVKDQKYDFLFWADNATGNYYDTKDLHSVALNGDYVGCDDKRDAFFNAIIQKPVTNAFSETVELRRPFAQLNVITKDIPSMYEQLPGDKSSFSKIVPDKVNVTVTAPSVFNVADSTASVDKEFTYEAAVYTSPYKTDAGKLNTLSMDYFYAPAEEGNVVEVKFTAKNTTSATFEPINYTWNNIPLRRNWRTNIMGNLLTKTGQIDVIIVPAWDGEKDIEK